MAGKSTDGYTSEWYLSGEDLCYVVKKGEVPLRVGDRLEIAGVQKTGNPEGDYQHWAVVYQVSPEPLMIHFTTGTQSGSGSSASDGSTGWLNASGISSGSALQTGLKGAKGNAKVKVEKISEYKRKLRINNSKDETLKALDVTAMREKMQQVLEDESLVGQYNLVKNNCEHFANYIRYGKRESDQAKNNPLAKVWSNITSQ